MTAQENTTITVSQKSNPQGKECVFVTGFDFSKYKIRLGGLLEDVLRSLPSPIHNSYYSLFLSVLRVLENDKKACRLLSLPPTELEVVDIETLFTIAEEEIERYLVRTGRYKSGARPSMLFRRVMKYLTTPLADGATITDVEFTTRFSDTYESRKLISEQFDKGCDDPEIASPISIIKAGNVEELNQKALQHLKARKNRIQNACNDVVLRFQKVRRHLVKLADTCLPDALAAVINDYTLSKESTKDALRGLPSEELLHFYVHFFKIHRLDDFDSFDSWRKRYGAFPFSEVLVEHPFVRDIGHDIKNKINRRKAILVGLILCQYILPPMVVMCCRHLLQLEFDWNMGTCNSVTSSKVTSTPDGYHISAIRPKTSQAFARDVSNSLLNSNGMHGIVVLLLDHSKWISQRWISESDSLFVGIVLGNSFPSAVPFKYENYNKQFISMYSLPYFTAEQLRDQGLNEHYLATQDIHSLKALAGWDSIDTAEHYLGQRIIRILSEANIYNFMTALEGSIIWATKGDDYLRRFDIDPSEVNQKLLFPINSESIVDDSSITDEWLNDHDTPIVINTERIKHTYCQANWYRMNWQELYSSNENRFISIHLPRMLVCLAVEKLITQSEYSYLYSGSEVAHD